MTNTDIALNTNQHNNIYNSPYFLFSNAIFSNKRNIVENKEINVVSSIMF